MEEIVREMTIRVIPGTDPVTNSESIKNRTLRMAAYCRVSTDSEEQINSYNAQKEYYTKLIADNPNWTMAGLFADEGISGTSLKNRDEFNRMIAACKRGRIDMILTKSISRFSRNTVDCLETVRMLKTMGIGVIFEKENINSLTESGEFMLTLFSAFAQAESESLSKNVTWGIRKRMQAGKVTFPYNSILGYRRSANGEPEIIPEEAETVKTIFRLYIMGYSLKGIAEELIVRQQKTKQGSSEWTGAAVQRILTNEKYAGDAILQKTFRTDCISKKVKVNNGELPKVYIQDHHPAIIARPAFEYVQKEMQRRSSKRKVQKKLAKTEQGKYSGKYALTERLICGECGSAYKRCTWNIRGRKEIVWRCISRLEYGKTFCHDSPTLKEELLHQAILSAINQYIDQNAVKDQAIEILKHAVSGPSEDEVDMAMLQRQAAQITSNQERILDMILDDMDNPELNAALQELSEKKQRILSLIEQKNQEAERQESIALRLQELREWIAEHDAGLREYDDLVTRKVVEKIIAIDKHTVKIKFYEDDNDITVTL